MKKIIAAAVATAFVAPVMAADITLSGSIGYNFIDNDATAVGEALTADDSQINVTAVQELANGLVVTGRFNVIDDTPNGLDNQGGNLQIAGPFGTLGLGDRNSALDAVGDYTDVSPLFGGFDGDSIGDANIQWTLPTFVEGLAIHASMSPEGDNYGSDPDAGTVASGEGLDSSSLAVQYSTGPVSFYYGQQDVERVAEETAADVVGGVAEDSVQTDSLKAYGISYGFAGFEVAYERGQRSNVADDADDFATQNAGDELEYAGLSLTYGITPDVTIGYERQETELDRLAVHQQDETILFVSYDMGDGVSVYAATKSSDSDFVETVDAENDQSGVGISFAF